MTYFAAPRKGRGSQLPVGSEGEAMRMVLVKSSPWQQEYASVYLLQGGERVPETGKVGEHFSSVN
jgi:hypothetical protein